MAVEHDEDDFLPETNSFKNRIPLILAIMVGVVTGLAFAFIGNCGM